MAGKIKLSDMPQELTDLLNAQGLLDGEVVIYAEADMDNNCQFKSHVLVLTEKRLIVGFKEEVESEVNRINHRKKHDWKTFIFKEYKIERLSEPEIEYFVVGGMFRVKIDGVDMPICTYTNIYNGRILKLCEFLTASINGEIISEDKKWEESKIGKCSKCGRPFANPERAVCPKCMDKRKIFFRLASFFKSHWVMIAALCILSVLTSIVSALWPVLNGSLLYDGILGKNHEISVLSKLPLYDFSVLLLMLTITMVVCKLLQQLFGVIQGRMIAKVVPDVVCKIKNKVFDAIQSLSVSFFTDRRTGGLMTRITGDAGQVSDMFIDVIPHILPNIFTILFSFFVMFSANWILAIVAIISLPIATIISIKLRPIMWHYHSKLHQTNRDYHARVNDNLVGARVVKAFGTEKDEINAINYENARTYDAMNKNLKFDIKFSALYETAKTLTALLTWGVGVCFVLGYLQPKITYGTLITFSGYVALLAGPANFFSNFFRLWTSSMNAAQRIFEIIDAQSDIKEIENPVKVAEIKGNLRLENVTFAYRENRNVIKDMSFQVNSGEMLGIVGKSGAGKSTLANLITRLYDVKEGHIYIDDVDIKDMSFDDIRKATALVSQETYIFKGTIFENIAYANPLADKKEVLNAAIIASAHDFICKLPDGYDTYIGSGTRSLSGGEKQRISIARAVLANPKILILDEATASVDTETEKKIQRAIQKLIKGRTTISIAHRISTLRDADKLIVVDDGKITEQGTHKELISKKGEYFKLVQIQNQALKMRGIGD